MRVSGYLGFQFSVKGSGLRVRSLWFRGEGLGSRVWGLRFMG